MKPSFPLLEKVAKQDNSTIGTEAGVIAGGIAAPFLISRLGRIRPEEIESVINNPANHEAVYSSTLSQTQHMRGFVPEGETLEGMAEMAAKAARKQAMNRLIVEPSSPYMREYSALAKKKNRIGMAAAIGMGILAPIIGSYIGSKFDGKK